MNPRASWGRTIPLLALCLAGAALADEVVGQGERLAALRAQVETLTDQVDMAREEMRADARGREAERADLEARIRSEELRLAELHRLVQSHRDALASDDLAQEHLDPALFTAADRLEATITAGLPYRVSERRQGVADIRNQRLAGTLSSQKAASRLWQVVEDELRLARENALDHQVVKLDGAEVLCDVARVGMVAIYYRTPSGDVGHAARAGDGWSWTPLDDRTDKAQVDELFDALHKQVRVGFFELPALFSAAEVN